MLSEITPRKVVFCQLVEHPGGSDGGEFPQYEEYGVSDDGGAYFSSGVPECPTDVFENDDVEREEFDHAGATRNLLAKLGNFYGSDAAELPVYKAFAEAKGEFVRYFDEETY